ncbi:hypothetical protein EF847_20080 [Actinobacteria bacterium YIM 96077]|uniref:Uncharacterized protein n=1 Tax=Phytoactinopolyspora halophila TaxID=1981511 RepID=A0A329QI91_9ACTN|nr:hypothetical protein [Phytoactinopolyspora halophila]AYY14647.1 hypothetical protein EF847_20080 [Actinobacteria bacterium YIM 96077]RAW11641.1 hypothetical protein DPM12_16370 [Phytoactinopolyspora halophila]
MTTHDDDSLARALHEVPVAQQRPRELIERRGRTLRRRHQASVAGVAVLVAGALAVPSMELFGDGPTSDAPTSTTEQCPDTHEDAERQINEVLGQPADTFVPDPAGVPDKLRLLWSERSNAPAPETANAHDHTDASSELASHYASCPVFAGQRVVLVAVEDGVVSRAVSVYYTEIAYEPDQDLTERVLDAGSTQVSIRHGEPGKDRVSADWGGDNESWSVVGYPLSDEEISTLAASVEVTDGEVDVSDWSVSAEADHVARLPALNSAVGGMMYEVFGGDDRSLGLRVDTYTNTLWSRASVGDRVVEIAGDPALLDADDGTLHWQPDEGVTATLSGELDGEQLMQIAETVRPVSGDDARLVRSWKTPGEER